MFIMLKTTAEKKEIWMGLLLLVNLLNSTRKIRAAAGGTPVTGILNGKPIDIFKSIEDGIALDYDNNPAEGGTHSGPKGDHYYFAIPNSISYTWKAKELYTRKRSFRIPLPVIWKP